MANEKNSEEDFNKGHRKRLREKFLKNPSGLFDYELLEMVLFSAYTRKDTKPIAKKLIKEFGSFSKVINANIYELEKYLGLKEAGISAIKLIKEASIRLLKKEIEKKILLDETDKICKYCNAKIGHLKTEQLRVLYVNSQFQLVADEVLSKGDTGETPIYKNIIITKATIYGAPYIILAHNHPSGNPHPSNKDIEITKNLKRILDELGLDLIDHIVVTANDSYSMQQNGHLGKFDYKKKKFMSEKEAKDFVNKKFKELLQKSKS